MRIDPRLARLAPLALIAVGLALGACARSGPAPVVFGGPSAGPETAAPAPRARPGVATSGSGTVRVAAGDTLYSIARRHGVALRDLIERNRLAPPYRLREGRVLALPKARTHRVAAGDTLYAISRRYGVDIYTVAAVNRIDPPYTIRVGQRLRIPDRHRRARERPAAGTVAAPAGTVTQAQPARTAKPAAPALEPVARPKPVPRSPAARSQRGSCGRCAAPSSRASVPRRAASTMTASTSPPAPARRSSPPRTASSPMPATSCAGSAICCWCATPAAGPRPTPTASGCW